jgi:hypothetical protein
MGQGFAFWNKQYINSEYSHLLGVHVACRSGPLSIAVDRWDGSQHDLLYQTWYKYHSKTTIFQYYSLAFGCVGLASEGLHDDVPGEKK